jgi:hypothetical protein
MIPKSNTDEQVDRIVKMMVSGEWKGAQSHKELAKEWGCHPRTVGDRAVAASAVVKRAGGDLEAWIMGKLAELDEIKETAMSQEKPDCKAAAAAVKLQLEARGVFVKKTQQVEPDDIDKMSPAEKIQAHEKAIADLRAEQAGETRH